MTRGFFFSPSVEHLAQSEKTPSILCVGQPSLVLPLDADERPLWWRGRTAGSRRQQDEDGREDAAEQLLVLNLEQVHFCMAVACMQVDGRGGADGPEGLPLDPMQPVPAGAGRPERPGDPGSGPHHQVGQEHHCCERDAFYLRGRVVADQRGRHGDRQRAEQTSTNSWGRWPGCSSGWRRAWRTGGGGTGRGRPGTGSCWNTPSCSWGYLRPCWRWRRSTAAWLLSAGRRRRWRRWSEPELPGIVLPANIPPLLQLERLVSDSISSRWNQEHSRAEGHWSFCNVTQLISVEK